VQRFGGALNLNVHVHALVADGVFVHVGGRARFCRTPPAGPGELEALTAVIARRIMTLLVRRGVWAEDEGAGADPWMDSQPVLAGLAAASVCGVAAIGPRAGTPVRRWGDAIDAPAPPRAAPWRARVEGFDVHAGVAVSARNRTRLEQLCRDALRPAVGQDRLQAMPDGTVALELRQRWTDGTSHLIFDPVELLARLAALVPRPAPAWPEVCRADPPDAPATMDGHAPAAQKAHNRPCVRIRRGRSGRGPITGIPWTRFDPANRGYHPRSPDASYQRPRSWGLNGSAASRHPRSCSS
jgi:hypothetical protein